MELFEFEFEFKIMSSIWIMLFIQCGDMIVRIVEVSVEASEGVEGELKTSTTEVGEQVMQLIWNESLRRTARVALSVVCGPSFKLTECRFDEMLSLSPEPGLQSLGYKIDCWVSTYWEHLPLRLVII